MGAEALLRAAVINNARWCDAVCRSHGYPGEFTGRLWISAGHTLPYYPNAITLSPDVTAAEATASQDLSRPFAIKDSFARLDLAPRGLTPLFDATWIAVSNVFKSGIADGPLWAGAVRAVARVRRGLPIVGYERGEDLAEARQAGFTVLGPLRVWAR
jgi:hypothetical protein